MATATRRKRCTRSSTDSSAAFRIWWCIRKPKSRSPAWSKLRKTHSVTLIPYGGGTNVTDALRCHAHEKRTIVSVDMSRMNRILWIDKKNQMACIQAGAVGRHIMAELQEVRRHDGPRTRQRGILDAGRLDRHQRQRHEEKPLRQHRRHRARRERRHRCRNARTRIGVAARIRRPGSAAS